MTFLDKINERREPTYGFEYLRLGLALAILTWHSMSVCYGPSLDKGIWAGPFRFVPACLVPMFFALSGFLVAGSLQRNPLHRFVALRVMRIFPALTVEVTLSAVVLGAIFTDLPLHQYFTSHEFWKYLCNTVGWVHTSLPGTFSHNPLPERVNSQLWTIPFEFECYAALIVMALLGVVKHLRVVLALTVAATVALTLNAFVRHGVSSESHVNGRALVLSFLYGVLIYGFRGRIKYGWGLGICSVALSIATLSVPDLSFVAAVPVAYMTVWIGLMRPPAIPFGDLSYGIYLFHYPVEQTMRALVPAANQWWELTAISIPTTAVIALGSWTLVERPIMTRKRLWLSIADKLVSFIPLANRHPAFRAPPPTGAAPNMARPEPSLQTTTPT